MIPAYAGSEERIHRVPTLSSGIIRLGVSYRSAANLDYERFVATIMNSWEQINGPVKSCIVFGMIRDRSASVKCRIGTPEDGCHLSVERHCFKAFLATLVVPEALEVLCACTLLTLQTP